MARKWTEQQKKEFGEKMKKLREEKKKNKAEQAKQANETHEEIAQSEEKHQSNQDVGELMKQIEELKKSQQFMQAAFAQGQTGPQVTAKGVVGTFDKYIVDPAHYPSPVERLTKEARLQRFAFDKNYELEFEIKTVGYETKDGQNMQEPKFTLTLNAIKFDEDTGEPTNGRYHLRELVLFEDPQSAIVVARQNGLPVEQENEKAFLDEMRYLRMRDWLLEAFYPPRNQESKRNKKEMVVDGRVVQYFEINSENSSGIPFSELNTKL